MARRRVSDQPLSRLALWSRRLALFAFVAAVLSIIVVRSGLLEIVPALATFGGALAMAVLAIALAIAAYTVIWRDGLEGAGMATSALFISLALLAYPAYLGAKAYSLPALYDITTDPIDPPRFEAVARIRPRETANAITYAGLYAAEQQRNAYPDIEPMLVSVTPQNAYEAVMTVINGRKWRPITDRSPQRSRGEGFVELVVRTPIMGFRDDVLIRIRPNGQGARIDLRSASRYGRHDLGTNAARIRGLMEDIEEAIDAQVPEKKPAPTTKAQAPAKGAPARR
jgi:uncharacterized protein (DUF1499 family)